jgi:hypothetical protein
LYACVEISWCNFVQWIYDNKNKNVQYVKINRETDLRDI